MTNLLPALASVPCSFMRHLTPSQLVSLLTRWDNTHDCYLNPVWLHNQGQNIIGFMPKTCFYLLPPNTKTDDSTDNLQLIKLTRKVLPDFSALMQQSNLSTHSKATLSNQLQLHLSNNQSTDGLLEQLIDYSKHYSTQSDMSHRSDGAEQSSQYTNGLIGFISYDVMADKLATNSDSQHQHKSPYLSDTQPTAFFGHYPLYLTCDIRENIHYWQLHATSEASNSMLPDVQSWLKKIIKITKPLVFKPPSLYLRPRWSVENYTHAFKTTQAYLYAGDCYQINLTQEWQGELLHSTRLADYLPKLHTFTQAPFASYLQLTNPKATSISMAKDNSQYHEKSTNFELLGCSPELFITFSKDKNNRHFIKTKPIKGTRPRGKNLYEDKDLRQELADSEKDLAENVMIVDLLRNDLGKYAKTGTVKVPKRFAVESFSNVHHLVSTITATLEEGVHPLKMLFGSLPAGSITGTPKKRSVEIINELEQQPRGAYCGTMGYMNFDGSGQWNVLIRTLQANQQQVSLWAGGGITVASECQQEYQECLDKVGNLLTLLAD